MNDDYQMFSDKGNQAVSRLVNKAKSEEQTWAWLQNELLKLSKNSDFSEAMDTDVRECAYESLGRRNEDFYV